MFSASGSRAHVPVEGYLVDTICSLAELHGCYFVQTSTVVSELPYRYHPGQPESSGSPTRVGAYWGTLIADAFGGVHPAPLNTGYDFADWVAGELLRAEGTSRSTIKPNRDLIRKMGEKLWCWQDSLPPGPQVLKVMLHDRARSSQTRLYSEQDQVPWWKSVASLQVSTSRIETGA